MVEKCEKRPIQTISGDFDGPGLPSPATCKSGLEHEHER